MGSSGVNAFVALSCFVTVVRGSYYCCNCYRVCAFVSHPHCVLELCLIEEWCF